MLQIISVNAQQRLNHVVEQQILVQTEYASAAQTTHAAFLEKLAFLGHANAELLRRVLDRLLDPIVMLLITFVNAQQRLLPAVEHLILVLVECVSVAQVTPVAYLVRHVAQAHASVVRLQVVLDKQQGLTVMQQIMCANVQRRLILAVALLIHVPMASVNVALEMLAAYLVKHVSQGFVSAEQLLPALEWLLVLIATLQIMYANAQQQWMLAVEQQILVQAGFASVGRTTHVVFLVKHVVRGLVCAELRLRALDKHPDLIVMLRTTSVNVRQQ